MQPGIPTYARLLAQQDVAASTALVTIPVFNFALAAGKTVIGRLVLPFLVAATGGFKFQITSDQTLVDYLASFEAIDGVTASPGAQVALTTETQAAFANAWAVAGKHECEINFSLKGHATLASNITIQFACNSAANQISVLKGAYMQLVQL